MHSRPLMVVAALGLAGALAANARAEPLADPGRGRELARTWCSSCHVIGPDVAGGDAGPPFAVVAGIPELTDDALTGWLFEPHAPMPDLDLPPAEIRDIVAYIRSLQP